VDVARAEAQHLRVGSGAPDFESGGGDAGGVREEAQQRRLVAREVAVLALDSHHWAAVEQRPLGERVGVQGKSLEEVGGVLRAREQFELAGRELVGGHLRDYVRVLSGVVERGLGPLEVGVGRAAVGDGVGADDVEGHDWTSCERA